MNLLSQQAASLGRDNNSGGGAGIGASAIAAPAQFAVGAVGFGPAWDDDDVQLTHKGWKTVTDSMAASIIRLEQENQELKAEVAVAEQERAILVRETERLREQLADSRNIIESLRDDACREKCRDKAAADGNWVNC